MYVDDQSTNITKDVIMAPCQDSRLVALCRRKEAAVDVYRCRRWRSEMAMDNTTQLTIALEACPTAVIQLFVLIPAHGTESRQVKTIPRHSSIHCCTTNWEN